MIMRAVSFTANVGEQVDEVFMSAEQTIDELARMLRARVLRYKILAGALTIGRSRRKYRPMPTNSKRKLSDWQIRAGR
jgi:hypothetical protein